MYKMDNRSSGVINPTHGLMDYIKNPDLTARYTKIEEKITIWYFLGEVA